VPVLVLAWATTASAGGLSFVENHTLLESGMQDVADLAVSADGANVYTASDNENTIGVYTRNPVTGAITLLETKEDGVGGVDGLHGATGVAVTPDGNCVYGVGRPDNKVATFSRNLVTGALTFVGTNAVTKPENLVISGDNLRYTSSGCRWETSGRSGCTANAARARCRSSRRGDVTTGSAGGQGVASVQTGHVRRGLFDGKNNHPP
jgi:6-phosphogluconolactonase (cycloisomerase 2 family)